MSRKEKHKQQTKSGWKIVIYTRVSGVWGQSLRPMKVGDLCGVSGKAGSFTRGRSLRLEPWPKRGRQKCEKNFHKDSRCSKDSTLPLEEMLPWKILDVPKTQHFHKNQHFYKSRVTHRLGEGESFYRRPWRGSGDGEWSQHLPGGDGRGQQRDRGHGGAPEAFLEEETAG
jgi:hypothetical protein